MQDSEIDTGTTPPPLVKERPKAVAPLWHTAIFIVLALTYSYFGTERLQYLTRTLNRGHFYERAEGMDVVLIAWVLSGLWLSRAQFTDVMGRLGWRPGKIAKDFALGCVLWLVCSFVVGGGMRLYELAASRVHPSPVTSTETKSTGTKSAETETHENGAAVSDTAGPAQSVDEAWKRARAEALSNPRTKTLMQLAPRTPSELLRWMFLCIIVGISEELVFRGYLMRQFLSWSGGSKTAAVVLSAVCFGASHGYQGITGMVGITVLGVLYGIVALKRGNLRVCIFAHIMQDLMAGIALFLLYNLGR